MNIVNVGYDSTNYYLIDSPVGKLLVDCGWPGTLAKLNAELKRKDILLGEDLPPRFMVPEEDRITQESWERIYRHGITRICPGHARSG